MGIGWLQRLVNVFRGRRIEAEIQREIAFHVAEKVDELRREGLDEAEAVRRARISFGNPVVQVERTRDVDVAGWLDSLIRNLRYALRTMRRSPGFAATVIVTLGVGIGANSAVFSVLDTVLLKPLPVPGGDRLVRVRQVLEAETPIAPGRLQDWAEGSTTLEGLTGYYIEDVTNTTGSFPERARQAVVAPHFLEVWGVAPMLGRGFSPDEARVGGPAAVLVSARYWRARLDADPAVLRRVVRIEGKPFAVAGVMPDSFLFPDRRVDFWWPYPVDGPALQPTTGNRQHQWYTGIGRLRENVTPEAARADLAAVQARLGQEYPDTDKSIGVRVVPYRQTLVGDVQGSLWLLYGAVSVLLLIASTNIAALLLSRAAQRRQDVAVRFALGASRRAVIGQLLTETVVLAFAAALLGLLVAFAASSAIHTLAPQLPRHEEMGVDGRMLAYTTASALVVAIACGLLPALRSTRSDPGFVRSGRGQVGGRHTAQWLLVGAQVTLSIALLAGAGLLFRSVSALARVDPGFDASGVLALRVSGSWDEAEERGSLVQRVETTLEHLRGLPGVVSVASAWTLPGLPRQYNTEFELVEGRSEGEQPLQAEWRSVSPGYFETLGIAIAGGELCRGGQADGSSFEVMVNNAFVDRYVPSRPLVGAHLRWEADSLTGRVIGIVGDAREAGLDRDPAPTVYACDSAPSPFPWLLLKTRGEPSALAASVRASLKDLEPQRSVYDLAPLSQRIGSAYDQVRMRMTLLMLFAATALALACLGVYGTLSYAVSLRRREVGLRLALGAERRDIVRGIVGQALWVVAVASFAGLLVSMALSRLLEGMLFGVSSHDPSTFVAVVAIVIGCGTLAALLPALRVSGVDPMSVLREE